MENIWKIVALIAILGRAVGAQNNCFALKAVNSELQLEYLQGERTSLAAECVLYAIDHLGYRGYVPAIPTLIKFLDYPDKSTNRGTTDSHRPKWAGSLYPAAEALFEIGKAAVPPLVAAISSSSSSELIRENALQTIFFIYREDFSEAVALLNRSGRSASDPEVSARLLAGAKSLAPRCPPVMRNSCIKALE